MNAREIFDQLLLDAKVKISFPSIEVLRALKSQLHTCKKRTNKVMDDIGSGDITEGKSIVFKTIEGSKENPPIVVEIALLNLKEFRTQPYTIIKIE